MRTRLLWAKMPLLWGLALAVHAGLAGSAPAQQTNIGLPFHTTSNGYFEQFGVNFGFQSHNFFFQQNSLGLAAPPFGGYTPNAAATTGFSIPVGGGQAYFNIAAGQGSQTSSVSQTPSATMMNGQTSGVFDTTQTPFVTSFAPPAAGFDSLLSERLQRLQQESPRTPHATQSGGASGGGDSGIPADDRSRSGFEGKLASQQSSSAARPTSSVAELRQQHEEQAAAAEDARRKELQGLLARAGEAEQAGKYSVARLYYEQAARRADAGERDELLSRARAAAEAAAAKKPARFSAAKQ